MNTLQNMSQYSEVNDMESVNDMLTVKSQELKINFTLNGQFVPYVTSNATLFVFRFDSFKKLVIMFGFHCEHWGFYIYRLYYIKLYYYI